MNILLNLDISPSLEDDLIDCLLGFESLTSFSSFDLRRHGGDARSLAEASTVEKVTGRVRVLRFEIVLEEARLTELLTRVSSKVAKSIPYSVRQLLDSGST